MQYRLSEIGTGRFQNISADLMFYTICDMNRMEDEFQSFFGCFYFEHIENLEEFLTKTVTIMVICEHVEQRGG